jgi:hypothetical protein
LPDNKLEQIVAGKAATGQGLRLSLHLCSSSPELKPIEKLKLKFNNKKAE